MNNKVSFTVSVSAKDIYEIITDLDLLFRLNIQWHMKSHNFSKAITKGSNYSVRVCYDRTDKELEYTAEISELIPSSLMIIDLKGAIDRKVIFRLEGYGERSSNFTLEEVRDKPLSREEIVELNLWAKSIINYAMIKQSRKITTRIWKFILDKIWLKLSPTGRRVVFFIVISEIFALFFFLMFVIYYLLKK